MDEIDYRQYADVYWRDRQIRYKRFETLAEAVCFVIERLLLKVGREAVIETEQQRYDHPAIQQMYDRPDYPLERVGRLARTS